MAQRLNMLEANARRYPLLFHDVNRVFPRFPQVIKQAATNIMSGDMGQKEVSVMRSLVDIFESDVPFFKTVRASSVCLLNMVRWPGQFAQAAQQIGRLPQERQDEIVLLLSKPMNRDSAAQLVALLNS
jgi:hypothetical protein